MPKCLGAEVSVHRPDPNAKIDTEVYTLHSNTTKKITYTPANDKKSFAGVSGLGWARSTV